MHLSGLMAVSSRAAVHNDGPAMMGLPRPGRGALTNLTVCSTVDLSRRGAPVVGDSLGASGGCTSLLARALGLAL